MATTPQTRYADTAVGPIAYQVVGEGGTDLLVLTGGALPIDLMWEQPLVVAFLNRLSTFGRHIWLDPAGSGASARDAPFGYGSTMDALSGVLEATGLASVALVACGTNATRAAFYAAAHPEQIRALVLVGGCARFVRDHDYPWGPSEEEVEDRLASIMQRFGTGESLVRSAPSVADDDDVRQWWGRCERLFSSPDRFPGIVRFVWGLDGREVLPMIHVPTLVIHRRGDRAMPVEHGRYLAEHIQGATYVELDGEDNWFFAGDSGPMLDAIEEFVTGQRPQVEIDRILATVLFTDIVSSTERASALGDHAWRDLLNRYRVLVREHLHRFRGREINTRGDDFLATFDSPARAIRCASAITEACEQLGVEVRTGQHTGEVELLGDDIGGIAVHIGARVSELAEPGEVLVSRTVCDLVAGSGIEFSERGEHELKGVPGAFHLFAVTA